MQNTVLCYICCLLQECMLDTLRKRYPCHVPCRVHLPHNKTLKLLIPLDATIACAMVTVRKRWPEKLSSADALFCFHGHKICIGNTRLATLDTDPTKEVHLTVRRENTFG